MKKIILIANFLLGLVFVTLAQPKHTIGEKWGGGVVFFVEADGLHGLIAETQDQGEATWDNARALVKNPSNHSDAGKAFTDWRLPKKNELNQLYLHKDIVGGFAGGNYWSSTKSTNGKAWGKHFINGFQDSFSVEHHQRVRAVRSF